MKPDTREQGPFLRLRLRVFSKDCTLTVHERIVALAVGDRFNGSGTCFPGQRDIAERSGCSVRQVRRILDKLCTGPDRLFDRVQAKHRQTYFYRFRDIERTPSPVAYIERTPSPLRSLLADSQSGKADSQSGNLPDSQSAQVSHSSKSPMEGEATPLDSPLTESEILDGLARMQAKESTR
jgi:hypothetical protein